MTNTNSWSSFRIFLNLSAITLLLTGVVTLLSSPEAPPPESTPQVLGLSINPSPISPVSQQSPTPVPSLDPERCSSRPQLDLSGALDPHLHKLSQYQNRCNSFVTDRLMIFTRMPATLNQATTMAHHMATTLQQFAQYQITPIVIIEPKSDAGLVNFLQFRDGAWDERISTYFQTLSQLGITADQLGIWVPFPEANVPLWDKNNATPQDIGLVIDRFASLLHQSFPQAQVSILLDSITYPNHDPSWSQGEQASLEPYLSTITPGSLTSFGLQGFPWQPHSESFSQRTITDPQYFLNPSLTADAAQTIGVNQVWFNTGTFAAKYTNLPNRTVTTTASERKMILSQIIEQAQVLKSQGFDVQINLFAENKSHTPEATNWSYLDTPTNNQEHFQVFAWFVQELEKNHIGFSLFDQ